MTLAELHRQQQLALRAVTLRQLVAIWPAFDISRIDESWPAVQQALTALIWLRNGQSSQLAAGYFQAARRHAGIIGVAPVVLADLPPVEQVATSLDFVGRVGAKQLVGAGRRDAVAVTLVKVAGTVGRLVLNGGRDTLTASIKADPRSNGYERVTSGNACEFCSMLADRGAVYGEESADFEAHDHCACSAEPVFA